jgi:predicted membrane metal-binding protein
MSHLVGKQLRLWLCFYGINIAIISGLFTFLFLRLLGSKRRFLAAGLSALVVALYTLLIGAEAAVVRAFSFRAPGGPSPGWNQQPGFCGGFEGCFYPAYLMGPLLPIIVYSYPDGQPLRLPVTEYHFYRLFLVASLVNPVIVSFQLPVMVFGGPAVLLGIPGYLWVE